MAEPLEMEDLLSLVTGDIVSERAYQDALRALLSGGAGVWRTIGEIDVTHAISKNCLSHSTGMGLKIIDGLRLTWAVNPDSIEPTEDPFCTIWFYYGRDGLLWHNVALFNRDSL